MSFKLFIYYCALCGGWAAFAAWAVVQGLGIRTVEPAFLRVVLVGGILGALVAGAVGMMDALLNAQGVQRFVRVAICMVLGGFGGLIGGLIGEMFYDHVSHVLLLIGWIFVGGLIGASIGAFDILNAAAAKRDMRPALKKTLNGAYGGFLGGFVGGLLFGLVFGIEFLPRSDLAIGLVILGLCIGLLIGLAQVVLKEAWLKVESGFPRRPRTHADQGRDDHRPCGVVRPRPVRRQHHRAVARPHRAEEQPVRAGRRGDGRRDVPQRQAGSEVHAAARRRRDPRRQKRTPLRGARKR